MKCKECGGEMEIRREEWANIVLVCKECGYKDYN